MIFERPSVPGVWVVVVNKYDPLSSNPAIHHSDPMSICLSVTNNLSGFDSLGYFDNWRR